MTTATACRSERSVHRGSVRRPTTTTITLTRAHPKPTWSERMTVTGALARTLHRRSRNARKRTYDGTARWPRAKTVQTVCSSSNDAKINATTTTKHTLPGEMALIVWFDSTAVCWLVDVAGDNNKTQCYTHTHTHAHVHTHAHARTRGHTAHNLTHAHTRTRTRAHAIIHATAWRRVVAARSAICERASAGR